ncbi:hypothetical protein J2T15_001905 [Paenibacillus harenae]|uniref:Uncharacterized protein n=1 Tax=Paenibacillus harenae TaxID=306543 RepID=A0ABT9TYM2_PAEHA|nr:hypothetical protein [Paenibacillus harenae]
MVGGGSKGRNEAIFISYEAVLIQLKENLGLVKNNEANLTSREPRFTSSEVCLIPFARRPKTVLNSEVLLPI